MRSLAFDHEFVPGKSERTLLLLHGTGGNEHDLIELGRALDPDATLLSPRGKVLENGMPRFFRRLAEGVFDLEDLKLRTDELADFIIGAARKYTLTLEKMIAVGYSNGANIAASTLLLQPNALHTAVLFRAMVPIIPDPLPALADVRVLICGGNQDQIIRSAEAERLTQLLRSCGANVSLELLDAGHGLTEHDVQIAHTWLVNL
jgi:predicted esterase